MFYEEGVRYRFSKSHNFRKFTAFSCGYVCIKRDKTDTIASILMHFYKLVVGILLKHKIDKVLYFLVKKVVFEEFKLHNSERLAFHKNWRCPCR